MSTFRGILLCLAVNVFARRARGRVFRETGIRPARLRTSWPFGKWNLYDVGIRAPLIVAWPGRIEPNTHSGDGVMNAYRIRSAGNSSRS